MSLLLFLILNSYKRKDFLRQRIKFLVLVALFAGLSALLSSPILRIALPLAASPAK